MGIRKWNSSTTTTDHSITTSSITGWTIISSTDTTLTTKRCHIEQYQVETDLDAIRDDDPSTLLNMRHLEAWNLLERGAEPVESMKQTFHPSPTETLTFTMEPLRMNGRNYEKITRIHTRLLRTD